jgi:hypothetical protein
MFESFGGGMAFVDVVELEVYGAFEADARDIEPVEEGVGGGGEGEEDEGGGEEEEGGQIGAESSARDEGLDGTEDGGLRGRVSS